MRVRKRGIEGQKARGVGIHPQLHVGVLQEKPMEVVVIHRHVDALAIVTGSGTHGEGEPATVSADDRQRELGPHVGRIHEGHIAGDGDGVSLAKMSARPSSMTASARTVTYGPAPT